MAKLSYYILFKSRKTYSVVLSVFVVTSPLGTPIQPFLGALFLVGLCSI